MSPVVPGCFNRLSARIACHYARCSCTRTMLLSVIPPGVLQWITLKSRFHCSATLLVALVAHTVGASIATKARTSATIATALAPVIAISRICRAPQSRANSPDRKQSSTLQSSCFMVWNQTSTLMDCLWNCARLGTLMGSMTSNLKFVDSHGESCCCCCCCCLQHRFCQLNVSIDLTRKQSTANILKQYCVHFFNVPNLES